MQPESVRAQFQPTEEMFLAMQLQIVHPHRTGGIVAFCVFILSTMLVRNTMDSSPFAGFAVIGCMAVALAVFFLTPVLLKKQLRKTYRQSKLLHSPVTCTFTPDGLVQSNQTGDLRTTWQDLHAQRETKEFFFFYTAPNQVAYLPKGALSPEESAAVRQFASAVPPYRSPRYRGLLVYLILLFVVIMLAFVLIVLGGR